MFRFSNFLPSWTGNATRNHSSSLPVKRLLECIRPRRTTLAGCLEHTVHTCTLLGASRNPTPFTSPPFFVICLSSCHMPVIRIPFSYLWLFCHILIISVSQPNLEKIYVTWYIPISTKPQKHMPNLVYTKRIFSGLELHVPVICLAYPCHNLFLFRILRPANEFQQVIELLFDFCILLHGVHQAQQDLIATGAPAGSSASGLPRTQDKTFRNICLKVQKDGKRIYYVQTY